jgi:hypothetical protein
MAGTAGYDSLVLVAQLSQRPGWSQVSKKSEGLSRGRFGTLSAKPFVP